MNKLTYRIETTDVFYDGAILHTCLWMNGQAVMRDQNFYTTIWSAKRGLSRIVKLLAPDVKVVEVKVA